jgi:heme-degrading monooxygenase HmoA
MVRHRIALRSVPGLRFARLLGTGHGRSFTPADADPRHWALLATWDSPATAAAFEGGPIAGAWSARADERWRLALQPISSVGRWSGRTPFESQAGAWSESPCAVLTRARLAPAKAAAFWRAIPPVAAEVRGASGLRFARGIGEAPIGLQATFSVWDSADAAMAFAYGSPAHRAVVERTPAAGWYAEQLFARFAVIESSGEVDGKDPLAVGSGGCEHLG